MGNCLKRQSSTTWAGDDWECMEQEIPSGEFYHERAGMIGVIEEESLLGEKIGSVRSTEVKIKITRKQLEDLLGKADLRGLSVEQMLVELMNVNDELHIRQRTWRPALSSIPEVN